MDDKQWHWQQFGTAWKGVGIYHITLVVSSREPLLGSLVIPNDNPQEAKVELSPFGEQVKACVETIPNVTVLCLYLILNNRIPFNYVLKTFQIAEVTLTLRFS